MYNQYRYKVELRYPYENNKELLLDNTNIHSIGISYDYDNKNMPILLMKIAVDKNIADDMVKNNKTKYMRLTISKYIFESKPKIYENYIDDQFIYFLDVNDYNNQRDLDYSGNTKDNKDIHKILTIGLIKQGLIDNNKQLINGIFNNQSLVNILLSFMSHMKILIEPPKSNNSLGNVIIPALDTVTKFVKHIDDTYSIYDTPYRLFYDYDKSYLLSSSGNPIASKDEKYSTVIINVLKETEINGRLQGINIDDSTKTYQMNIVTSDINMFENTATSKSYDTIIGIDSNGNTKKVSISDSSTNVKIQKLNNLNTLDSIKSDIDNKSIMVNVSKVDIDTSLITINKEYYIKNYDKISDSNAKFILASKREIYSRDQEDFALTTFMVFKKIKS